MVMSILKDWAYARYFASKPSTKPVGMVSLGFWFIWDVATIGGAFVVPHRLANMLKKTGVDEEVAENSTQMASPILF